MGAVPAGAHAILVTSDPADGATLSASPGTVTLTFTEVPDPALSAVHVLNEQGTSLEKGPAHAVAGLPRDLAVDLPALPKGVYTVTWRVTSQTDGHITGGAFAFGVGESPGSVVLPKVSAPITPAPSPLSIAGRWLFYAGVILLLGGAWIAALVREASRARGPRIVAWTGVVGGIAGVVAYGFAQASQIGVGIGALLRTAQGHALIWRAAPLVAAAIALAFIGRVAEVLAAFGAAGSMLADVVYGHAASGRLVWGKIALQWVHVVAAGIWIGGLVAVLAALKSLEPDRRVNLVRRFSQVALYAVATVAATGVARAVDEYGSLHLLFTSSFGQMLIVKSALLAVIVVLAWFNRYRNVAAVASSERGLVVFSRAEVLLAAGILVATSILVSVAPGQSTLAAARANIREIEATANDLGTTVKVDIVATPGTPGPNRFVATVRDYNTGAIVRAPTLPLTFTFLGRPGISPSTLTLRAQSNGTLTGTGSNLAFLGPWQVSAFVARGSASTTVQLSLATVIDQQMQVLPGNPTIYQVSFTGNRLVQFYVDQGPGGRDEVHATYIRNGGEFRGLSEPSMVATPAGGKTIALAAHLFSVGHWIGDGTLTPGHWRFDVSVLMPDGTPLSAYFEQSIG